MKKGKIIVIDGIDGAGKTTQSNLLIDHLKRQKIPHKYLHFPRYDTFFGDVVKRFLNGEFGSLDNVSPVLASIVYALDRSEAKRELNEGLEKGTTIVLDRYISSNMAHQGSKFDSQAKRNAFLEWLNELEYEQLDIPKEDMIFWLDMPVEKAQELIIKRNGGVVKGHEDIHEKDRKYQEKTRSVYDYLSKKYPGWKRIECTNNRGEVLGPDMIHHSIIKMI